MPRLRPLGLVVLAALAACQNEPSRLHASGAWTTFAIAAGETANQEPRELPIVEIDEEDDGSDEVVAATAVDLVPTSPGATLLWTDDHRVLAARLSPSGVEQRRVIVATAPGVAELSAAATSDRLAAVWIGADNTLSTSSASLSDMAFTPVRSLGATEPFEAARTGRLAASATPAGRLLALARTIDEPCQRYDAPSCANFAILDLLEADASQRPRLEVPHPCPRPVVGFAVTSRHWHYALCHREGPLSTTVLFTAQPSPSYAQTNDVLAGCEPQGLTRDGDDLWLTGSCGGTQRAVHVRELGVSPGAATPSDEVTCSGGELAVRLGDRTLVADDRTVGLGALLSRHLVPSDARAVWTGHALVVARVRDGRLELERHDCVGGKLQHL